MRCWCDSGECLTEDRGLEEQAERSSEGQEAGMTRAGSRGEWCEREGPGSVGRYGSGMSLEFGSYCMSNGEPLKGFKWGSDILSEGPENREDALHNPASGDGGGLWWAQERQGTS